MNINGVLLRCIGNLDFVWFAVRYQEIAAAAAAIFDSFRRRRRRSQEEYVLPSTYVSTVKGLPGNPGILKYRRLFIFRPAGGWGRDFTILSKYFSRFIYLYKSMYVDNMWLVSEVQ